MVARVAAGEMQRAHTELEAAEEAFAEGENVRPGSGETLLVERERFRIEREGVRRRRRSPRGRMCVGGKRIT